MPSPSSQLVPTDDLLLLRLDALEMSLICHNIPKALHHVVDIQKHYAGPKEEDS